MKITEEQFIEEKISSMTAQEVVDAIVWYHNGHYNDEDILKACGVFDFMFEKYRDKHYRCHSCGDFFDEPEDLDDNELCKDCAYRETTAEKINCEIARDAISEQ